MNFESRNLVQSIILVIVLTAVGCGAGKHSKSRHDAPEGPSQKHEVVNRNPGFDVSGYHLFDPSLEPIKFYGKNEPYYELTNFFLLESPRFQPPVFQWEGSLYRTSEHAFQAKKFNPHSDQWDKFFEARTSESPSVAFRLGSQAYSKNGRVHHDVRHKLVKGWLAERDDVMHQILLAKFNLGSLKQLLLDTHNRMLVEWTDFPGGDQSQPIDEYWGTNRHSGQGKNHLGKILMLVRAELQTHRVISDDQVHEIIDGLSRD